MKELVKLLNINLRFITARNSRGNANIERSFRNLQNLLKSLHTTNESLETCVNVAVFIMNNRKNKESNLTPYEIVTFRHSSFPVNIPYFSKSQVDKLPHLAKKYYETAQDLVKDLQQRLRQRKITKADDEKMYQRNDLVLLKNYNKSGTKKALLPAYSTEKFRIISTNPWTKTYEIERIDNDKRAHRTRFKVHHRIIKKLNTKYHDLINHEPERIKESEDEQTKNTGEVDAESKTDDSRSHTTLPQPVSKYNLRKRK